MTPLGIEVCQVRGRGKVSLHPHTKQRRRKMLSYRANLVCLEPKYFPLFEYEPSPPPCFNKLPCPRDKSTRNRKHRVRSTQQTRHCHYQHHRCCLGPLVRWVHRELDPLNPRLRVFRHTSACALPCFMSHPPRSGECQNSTPATRSSALNRFRSWAMAMDAGPKHNPPKKTALTST